MEHPAFTMSMFGSKADLVKARDLAFQERVDSFKKTLGVILAAAIPEEKDRQVEVETHKDADQVIFNLFDGQVSITGTILPEVVPRWEFAATVCRQISGGYWDPPDVEEHDIYEGDNFVQAATAATLSFWQDRIHGALESAFHEPVEPMEATCGPR